MALASTSMSVTYAWIFSFTMSMKADDSAPYNDDNNNNDESS